MNKLFKSYLFLFLMLSGITILSSCTDEPYYEKLAGPWKVTKVEQGFYNSNSSTQPDSLVTYESDTLGYYNFYNSNPGIVYFFTNYSSPYSNSGYSMEYEVHPNNNEIMNFIYYSSYDQEYHCLTFTVTNPGKKKQQWTTISNYKSGFTIEKIWVEKQD